MNNIEAENQKGEIGFWLLKKHWQKGIISEPLPLILNFSFMKLNLHRLEAVIESQNEPSIKVVERSGFIKEGLLKECEMKNGKFIDICIYAKLNSN